jgi:hypothetical protein
MMEYWNNGIMLVKLQITKYKLQITNKVAPFGQVVNAAAKRGKLERGKLGS